MSAVRDGTIAAAPIKAIVTEGLYVPWVSLDGVFFNRLLLLLRSCSMSKVSFVVCKGAFAISATRMFAYAVALSWGVASGRLPALSVICADDSEAPFSDSGKCDVEAGVSRHLDGMMRMRELIA
jgi:hypothetical protein